MTVTAVIDTKVIISGFLWQGLPYHILRLAEDSKINIFTSIPLLELTRQTML